MSHSFAIRRAKTRRRRKRPLSPWGCLALFFLLANGVLVGKHVFEMGMGTATPMDFFWALLEAGFSFFWWPVFWREWKRRDDG